jgi:uncharacterized protein (TIGR00730 family)
MPKKQDPDRLNSILTSPSYAEADQDLQFLDSGEMRGVRLQLDYLKAELTLQRDNIQHTIVVFGSTRILDPTAARAQHANLLDQVQLSPNDQALQSQLAAATKALEQSRYYEIARDFGARVGQSNPHPTPAAPVIMTGGGPGIMEAANRGAASAGAPSIGLNISLAQVQEPNPYITPHLSFQFHYFAIRKLHLLLRARALVVFPGGFGTFDELFEILTLVQTGKVAPLPVVLVGREFWNQAVNFNFLVAEGMIDRQDCELFTYAESADEIISNIAAWHAARGTPLVRP